MKSQAKYRTKLVEKMEAAAKKAGLKQADPVAEPKNENISELGRKNSIEAVILDLEEGLLS